MPAIYCHRLHDVPWVGAGVPAGPVPDPPVVYCLRISGFNAHLPRLASLLQPDEQSRAGRYHQPKDRQRFVVARGMLRLLLSHYTKLRPADIRFSADGRKKPVLAGFSDLHYNVTHAGDRVLIAIANRPVGIDVEQMVAAFTFVDILVQSFSPDERSFINNAPDNRFGFYELWTRKEALVKATGKGIDDDFVRIPSLDGLHLVTGELIGSVDDWTIGSFLLDEEYVVSVAYSGWATPSGPQPVFCEMGPALLIPIDAPPG